MGRPYAAELRELDATYRWSLRTPVDELTRSIHHFARFDALIVGSGGSLTSAHFASFLHARITGRAAQTLTPFELASLERTLDATAVLICSAGGSNPDIIAAAQFAIKRAPVRLVAITTRSGSPLEDAFKHAGWSDCHAFSTPTRKDGFLATNSLLATLVLLIRAYESFAGAASSLPPALEELLHPRKTRDEYVEQVRRDAGPAMARDTIIVLHGTATKPAAMDVESRFTEAALAAIQPADYRNFAHGRHHWLARHATSSAVIAFSTEGDDVARKTLALVPAAIPRHQVFVGADICGALAAVCHSLFLGHIAGGVKGIDPGRPHVPTFGRRLYHLRAMPQLYGGVDAVVERMNLAIERKARLPIYALSARGEIDNWKERYLAFVDRLAAVRIKAVALDYDGTLCGPERRLLGPSAPLLKRLNALLAAGYVLAVATGRGKSVREALRVHITSPAHRARVIIGYHNGAEVGSLADADFPPPQPPLVSDLVAVVAALKTSSVISRHVVIEAKGSQIAMELQPTGDAAAVFEEATRVVRRTASCGKISIVTSGHSVDIIAAGVSKLNVISRLIRDLGLANNGADSVLCIGDRGRLPGNDADLLCHPLSLSVDEVNSDPATCWTLAEPGRRFDLACLEYLNRLRPTKQGLRFSVKGVRP
jgi:hypothetical protein